MWTYLNDSHKDLIAELTKNKMFTPDLEAKFSAAIGDYKNLRK
jgi:hypothetical protein